MNLLTKIYAVLLILSPLLCLDSPPIHAWEHITMNHHFDPANNTVIGRVRHILYSGIKTAPQIAREFHIGYKEMADANRGIYPDRSIDGKEIVIPASWVLPEIMEEGILINLSEMRLYFFHGPGEIAPVVSTFPIGIGRSGFETPTGTFKVEFKLRDPVWYPGKTAKKYNPLLPDEFPPGPDNPLGAYWVQLSISDYGIHSTNRPDTIGQKSSLGCIRLFPENMEWLFPKIRPGIPVKIINMPVKFGIREGIYFVEVHGGDLSDEDIEKKALEIIKEKGYEDIDKESLMNALIESRGLPIPVMSGMNGTRDISRP